MGVLFLLVVGVVLVGPQGFSGGAFEPWTNRCLSWFMSFDFSGSVLSLYQVSRIFCFSSELRAHVFVFWFLCVVCGCLV